MEVTDSAIAKAKANREEAEASKEAIEADTEKAENLKKNFLPALNAVIQAQNKLKDIEERIKDAIGDMVFNKECWVHKFVSKLWLWFCPFGFG